MLSNISNWRASSYESLALVCTFAQSDSLFYLDDVQFWQKVAVCKSELIPIKEASVGALFLIHAVCIDLIGQGGVQVVVQLLQGFGQTYL